MGLTELFDCNRLFNGHECPVRVWTFWVQLGASILWNEYYICCFSRNFPFIFLPKWLVKGKVLKCQMVLSWTQRDDISICRLCSRHRLWGWDSNLELSSGLDRQGFPWQPSRAWSWGTSGSEKHCLWLPRLVYIYHIIAVWQVDMWAGDKPFTLANILIYSQ